MSIIKPLEWREVTGGYAGFIDDRAWTRVDHGWNLAEPYEYRGERYADLNRAKALAETDHQMAIVSTLVDGVMELATPAEIAANIDILTTAIMLEIQGAIENAGVSEGERYSDGHEISIDEAVLRDAITEIIALGGKK